MSYTKPAPKPVASCQLSVRITARQRKMLDEMTQEYGAYLSDVVRNILDRELMRRKQARESMVPPRRR